MHGKQDKCCLKLRSFSRKVCKQYLIFLLLNQKYVMVTQKSHVNETPNIYENIWVRNYFKFDLEKSLSIFIDHSMLFLYILCKILYGIVYIVGFQ